MGSAVGSSAAGKMRHLNSAVTSCKSEAMPLPSADPQSEAMPLPPGDGRVQIRSPARWAGTPWTHFQKPPKIPPHGPALAFPWVFACEMHSP
jgi:hypothetical protein